MNTSKVEKDIKPWTDVVLSKTLLMFHGTILISIIIIMVIMILTN